MIVIKTTEEINKIRKANKIIAELLDVVIPENIKDGISTYDLDKISEEFILKNNARPGFKGYRVGGMTYPATLCTSINEEVVHGIPSKKRILKSGDIISIDVGTIVEGFYGDAARTYAIGKVDEETAKLIKITEESLYEGIKQAIKGNRITDISNAIQVYAEKRGFSLVRDYCGHGIGQYLHEDPQIPNFGPKGRGHKIEDGMVLAIEPMVNQGTYKVKVLSDGWTVITNDRKKSAHFEHSVAIIGGKPEILSLLQ